MKNYSSKSYNVHCCFFDYHLDYVSIVKNDKLSVILCLTINKYC